MIRLAFALVWFGLPAAAQDWRFAINIDNGAIDAAESGSKQAEYATFGPYMSAEAFAVVPSGALPPCKDVDRFEIDLFFGWDADSNGHIMAELNKGGSEDWAIIDPWLLVTMDTASETLVDDAIDMRLDSVTCADDTTLQVAMSLTGKVAGEGQTLPVTVRAQVNAPIQHYDNY